MGPWDGSSMHRVVFAVGLVGGVAVGFPLGRWSILPSMHVGDDEIQNLRNAQARQAVDLEDARARIRALEAELDRIAPRRVVQ
jgi:hypothetical protein